MSNAKPLVLLDAPSNLGLRPPADGVAPGVYKLAGALRNQRLLERVGGRDAGVVTPPRYLPDHQPGMRTRNQDGIARYTGRLAERVGNILDDGGFPLVLGGDCSILLGPALALRRRGRYGLAYVDAHGDFRHPGNAQSLGAAAGEDLAIVTGRGPADLIDIDNLSPYVRDADVVVLGIREDDEEDGADGWLHGIRAAGMAVLPASEVAGRAIEAGTRALAHLERDDLEGFWLHVDADVLDGKLMPAVDSPTPGGIDWDDLAELLTTLLSSSKVAGMQVTIFDPDLDPDDSLAAKLADAIAGPLTATVSPAPAQVAG